MDGQVKRIASAGVLFAVLLGLVLLPGPTTDDRELDEINRSSLGQVSGNTSMNSTINAVFTDGNQRLAELELEAANTPEERRIGLMNRTSLEKGTGMIFIWDEAEERSFWMKNTYIPLDMIFLTAERTVRTIKEADPEPNVSEENLKRYASEGPAKYVIETHQNFSEEQGVEKGSKVVFN